MARRRVTEAAAVAASKLIGRGDEKAADAFLERLPITTHVALRGDPGRNRSLGHGRRHLRSLAAAGLTHVHLLPAFDIATVPEYRTDQVEVDDAELAAQPVAAVSEALAGVAPVPQRLERDAGREPPRAPTQFRVKF